MAEIDDFDTLEAEVEFLSKLFDALVVTQEDGMTYSFCFGLYGCLEHGRVYAFGKHYALGIAAGGVVELAGELALLTHELAQLSGVGLPVGDGLACHTALHGSTGYSHRYAGDKTGIYGFRNEV